MKTKHILLTLAVAVVALGFAVGLKPVRAEDPTAQTYPSLIQKLMDTFKLNKTDVDTVIEQDRTERQNEMLQIREERLNKAVTDGIITSAQKDALMKKMEENQQEREKHREEMQNWFETQGIDQNNLRPYMGFGQGRHGDGMMYKGMERGMWGNN